MDEQTGELFSYVHLEKRVRSHHPLRAIRGLVNEALVALEQEFAALYGLIGRPPLIKAWASMKGFRPKDVSDELPADGTGRRIFTARRARTTPRLDYRFRGEALS